jgi:hypothetical protein
VCTARARRLAVTVALAAAALPPAARAQADTARASDSVPQIDALDVLARIIGKRPQPPQRGQAPGPVISILPAFSANPSVGVLLGVTGNVVTRLEPRELTDLSILQASVNFTTKQQFNIIARSSIFLPRNRLKLDGDWRYLDSNQPTFGLGPAQPESSRDEVDFRLLRLQQSVLRQTIPSVYVGAGYVLNGYFDIRDHNAERGLPSPIVAWEGGRVLTKTVSSGLSFNAVAETRDNPVNASRGIYAAAAFQLFPTWLGSDTSWQAGVLGHRVVHLRPSAVPRPAGHRLGLLQPQRARLRAGSHPQSQSALRRGRVPGRPHPERPVRSGGLPEPHLGERSGHRDTAVAQSRRRRGAADQAHGRVQYQHHPRLRHRGPGLERTLPRQQRGVLRPPPRPRAQRGDPASMSGTLPASA